MVDLDEIEQWISQARGNVPSGIEVTVSPEAGMTTAEWAEHWMMGENHSRDRLRMMKKVGRVVVDKAKRVGLNDKEYLATVYRVVGKE